MKEEDLDWLVYHQLPEGAPLDIGDLATRCGLGMSELEVSLERLERSCIIERTGSSVRVLSFGEALIRNQMKYEEDLPFIIENGVVKAKKRVP